MKLDRELQKDILIHLSEDYTKPFSTELSELEYIFGSDIATELLYLHGHELISGTEALIPYPGTFGKFQGYRSIDDIRITEKGLDFIQQDGGLSAILDKVTFKLDEEQFNDILVLAVDQSTIPTDQKPVLKKALKTAGHTTITTLITKGLESAPELIAQLAKAI